MHRLGPLRGRLVPQPQSFRAGRPACLDGYAFAGILRMLFRSALPAVAWGRLAHLRRAPPRFAWAPYGRPGGRPAATLVASGRYAPAAATVPLRSASRPFGSHRRPAPSTSQRSVAMTCRGSTRSHPSLRCASFSRYATPLRRGLQSGGARAFGACRRAPPPLGVGRWGALKPTTLCCRFSPGGSPVPA